MFTLHSIGCLNAVLLKLYACEVKKIFLQFSYPSFYWLRGVCPVATQGTHVGIRRCFHVLECVCCAALLNGELSPCSHFCLS